MNQLVIMTYPTLRTSLLSSFLVACLLVVASGCDGLFDVKNPGTIQDEDLNNPDALSAVVTGMSADLSAALDGIAFVGVRLSDEMATSGSYFITTRARHGYIDPEDADAYWEGIQRARFAAEDGLRRMREVLGDSYEGQEELAARAYLLAGLSNRVFGENFVQVTFNGGPVQPRSAAFERADSLLQLSVQWADQAGASDIRTAAIGARAQVQANLGNWGDARDLAGQVPTDFVYNAFFSNNSGREQNELHVETHQRYEVSAFGTIAATDPQDPRAPYTDCRNENPACSAEIGADGRTPHLRQEKYPDLGADIPLVKGTEMRLIEAEAALVEDNDAGTAMNHINEVRAFYDLDDLSAPDGVGEAGPDGFEPGTAWYHLDRERLLTLWLEARRLNDLHRWDHPYKYGPGEVDIAYEQQPDVRAVILPIAESECLNNDNITDADCTVTYQD